MYLHTRLIYLGSVFKDFTKLEMNEIALIVAIYDFSIDDDVTNIENILVIFDKKKNIIYKWFLKWYSFQYKVL